MKSRLFDLLLGRTGVLLLLVLGAGLYVLQSSRSSNEGTIFFALWTSREPDLLFQLALMFAGALGIRALLPGRDEEG